MKPVPPPFLSIREKMMFHFSKKSKSTARLYQSYCYETPSMAPAAQAKNCLLSPLTNRARFFQEKNRFCFFQIRAHEFKVFIQHNAITVNNRNIFFQKNFMNITERYI